MKLTTITFPEEDFQLAELDRAIDSTMVLLERFDDDADAVMRYLDERDATKAVEA